MKKTLHVMMILTVLVFSGCNGKQVDPKKLEKAYEVGKVGYKVGKVVVKATAPLIGAETMETLKVVDKVAVSVDGVRTELKKDVPTLSSIEAN